MKLVSLSLASVSLIAICLVTASPVRADDGGDGNFRLNRYVVTNLTSDVPGVALNTDPVLQNSWGVAFSPGASPFWIADNATGCSTLPRRGNANYARLLSSLVAKAGAPCPKKT